jgi:hypothetical protein
MRMFCITIEIRKHLGKWLMKFTNLLHFSWEKGKAFAVNQNEIFIRFTDIYKTLIPLEFYYLFILINDVSDKLIEE